MQRRRLRLELPVAAATGDEGRAFCPPFFVPTICACRVSTWTPAVTNIVAPKVLRRRAVDPVPMACEREITIGPGRLASLFVWAAVGLWGCGQARIASEIPAEGQCVPVLCPIGEVEAEGRVVAARMAGEGIELLVDGLQHAWVVSGTGERRRIELPNEDRSREENGVISVSAGGEWSVDKGMAAGNGFVFLVQASRPSSSHASPKLNSTLFGLWRVEDGDVVWRRELEASHFWEHRIGCSLAVSGQEVAVAYLTDDEDPFEQAFTVERRSLATGELLSSTHFEGAQTWSTAALHYTPEGLLFAWAPEGSFLTGAMFVSEVEGSPVRVPRSRRYGQVALTPSGVLAVERAAGVGGRLLLDGDPILRLGAHFVFLTDMSAIETDKGIAVAFEVSGVRDQQRKGYSGIVGDSGVALAIEHAPQTWTRSRHEIVPLDSERLLLVEGEAHRSLSVLTCADSRSTAGRMCETPEELRLRSGRDVIAR